MHGAVQLGSNTGRAWHQRAYVRMDIAKPFIAGSVVGAIVGVFLVVQLPDALLKLVLGGFILVLTWAKIPGIDRLTRAGLAVASVVLALLSHAGRRDGTAGRGAVCQVPRERPQGAGRDQRVAMTAQHLLKIVVFGLAGFAFWELGAAGCGNDPVGLSRHRLRHHAARTLPEETFRKWFRIGITVLALDLLRRGLTALYLINPR